MSVTECSCQGKACSCALYLPRLRTLTHSYSLQSFSGKYQEILSVIGPMINAQSCGIAFAGGKLESKAPPKYSPATQLSGKIPDLKKTGTEMWGCRHLSAMFRTLNAAIGDSNTLRWLVYEGTANSNYGPKKEFDALLAIAAKSDELIAQDEEIERRVNEKDDTIVRKERRGEGGGGGIVWH